MAAPFASRLLGARCYSGLLPATIRTQQDDIVVPTPGDLDFLEQELLVNRLNYIHGWLWMVGRPIPPRPLHYQFVLRREVILTEQMELHLTWDRKRILIKPISSFLLDPDFWKDHLSNSQQDPNNGRRQKIAACARGFLFSYCALVSRESDFNIARTYGLMPADIQWKDWKTWSKEVLAHCPYSTLNRRFWYGELRLGRLNTIYRYSQGHVINGYTRVSSYRVYGEFFTQNFTTLAGILGYVVIVLTAMQVGLATDRLQPSSAFQSVSYGFTVFAIIGPLVASILIVGAFLVMFISNWISTKRYEKVRFRVMGVDPNNIVQ